jgi:hypothetical protein
MDTNQIEGLVGSRRRTGWRDRREEAEYTALTAGREPAQMALGEVRWLLDRLATVRMLGPLDWRQKRHYDDLVAREDELIG